MDSANAFIKGELNRGKELMVFDWNQAATLINKHKINHASAGLSGDWEWTGGTIYENGKVVNEEDTYVYLASTWATPEICINGEYIDCYLMKSKTDNWDASTYWPESALFILKKR